MIPKYSHNNEELVSFADANLIFPYEPHLCSMLYGSGSGSGHINKRDAEQISRAISRTQKCTQEYVAGMRIAYTRGLYSIKCECLHADIFENVTIWLNV